MSVPITILTGFLGSGKTTLLNQWVQQPSMQQAFVLVNEAGDVSSDHHLVEEVTERKMVMPSGCVCCALSRGVHRRSGNAGQEDGAGSDGLARGGRQACRGASQRASRHGEPAADEPYVHTHGIRTFTVDSEARMNDAVFKDVTESLRGVISTDSM